MTKMSNRVYGVIGVGVDLANWNADFTGNPRTLSDGTIFASDKALKYAIKQLWVSEGEEVLYKKTLVKTPKGVQPLDLTGSFEALSGLKVSKLKKSTIADVLLSYVDVENFGGTFAVSSLNMGITGVVQVGQAVNKFEESNVETLDIISPFRNGADDMNTTVGKKIIVDEAHFVYPFSVNPHNLDYLSLITDTFDGYSLESYVKFKDASLVAATALNTNSKQGAYNHFGLFIELKDGSKKLLPQLDKYVFITRKDGKVVIDVTAITKIVRSIENDVDNAEIFIDDNFVELVGADVFSIKNIFSKEVI